MKKKLFIAAVIGVTALAGCDTEVNRVSYNLSQEADNFNDIRQITVINCLQGDVLFQMTGKMSITADTSDNQLEIIVEEITLRLVVDESISQTNLEELVNEFKSNKRESLL